MANYSTLKAAIQQVIKANGNNEITGDLLQQSLLAMINSLGAGYQFVGGATPATNPGTPDNNVFYLATETGTYTNFGGIVVGDEIAFLAWNGSWAKTSIPQGGGGSGQKIITGGIFQNTSINGYIDYNTVDGTISIPRSIIFILSDGYIQMSSSYITLSVPSSGVSALKLVYDTTDSSFSFIGYNVENTQTQITIASIRRDCNISSIYPWSINGLPYGADSRNPVGGVPSSKGKYINFDTFREIITIPQDTVIFSGTKYFLISPSAPVEIYVGSSSGGGGASSAKKILYNVRTSTFSVIPYSTYQTQEQIFILSIRRKDGVQNICCMLPWSINGKPYGILQGNDRAFILGINHRGYTDIAPENTLPAFRYSAGHNFKLVETDVRFTSDGVAVLLHDVSINRTARNMDGSTIATTINIADITYEQALNYDFGIAKSQAFAGTPIPTFDEFILLCRNLGLKPYIELKAGTALQIQGLLSITDKYKMTDKCTWIGWADKLAYISAINIYARLGLVVSSVNSSVITSAQSLKLNTNEVFIDSSDYDADAISLCSNAGIPLEIWTINSLSIIKNLDPYITGVTSNNIDAGIEIFRYNERG